MEDDRFQPNELIRIINGYCKEGRNNNLEVHIGKKGKVELSPKEIDSSKIPKNDEVQKKPVLKGQRATSSSIRGITQEEGYVSSVEGVVYIEEFKEINLKNGEKTFLLKLKLSDYDTSIHVAIWRMAAVNCLKMINEGDLVRISNLKVKFNDYTKKRELIFTSKSSLERVA